MHADDEKRPLLWSRKITEEQRQHIKDFCYYNRANARTEAHVKEYAGNPFTNRGFKVWPEQMLTLVYTCTRAIVCFVLLSFFESCFLFVRCRCSGPSISTVNCSGPASVACASVTSYRMSYPAQYRPVLPHLLTDFSDRAGISTRMYANPNSKVSLETIWRMFCTTSATPLC